MVIGRFSKRDPCPHNLEHWKKEKASDAGGWRRSKTQRRRYDIKPLDGGDFRALTEIGEGKGEAERGGSIRNTTNGHLERGIVCYLGGLGNTKRHCTSKLILN